MWCRIETQPPKHLPARVNDKEQSISLPPGALESLVLRSSSIVEGWWGKELKTWMKDCIHSAATLLFSV